MTTSPEIFDETIEMTVPAKVSGRTFKTEQRNFHEMALIDHGDDFEGPIEWRRRFDRVLDYLDSIIDYEEDQQA